MRIPAWGLVALVAGAVAIGVTVGALGALVEGDDGSETGQVERANAQLRTQLEKADEATEAAEGAAADAEDAAAEAEAQVEQLEAENGLLEQRVSDLQSELDEPPPTAPAPTAPPAPLVFGPGIYQVGVDMPAGVYRTTDIACYHGKFQTPTGGVLEGGFGYGPAEVTVDSPWFKIDFAPNARPGARCSFTKVG